MRESDIALRLKLRGFKVEHTGPDNVIYFEVNNFGSNGDHKGWLPLPSSTVHDKFIGNGMEH